MHNRIRPQMPARIAAMIALSAASALAQTSLYWDANSSLGGAGAWDVNTTMNWSTTNAAGAPNATWNPNDGSVNAVFNGSASYAVTIASGATINANSVSFGVSAGNAQITGGTALNIANAAASILMNTSVGSSREQVIKSNLTGGDITVVGNITPTTNQRMLLSLAGNNSFTGNLVLAGSGTPVSFTNGGLLVNINTANSLPSTASVLMDRTYCQLLFTDGGAVSGSGALVATYNNPINLNATGTGIFESGIGSTNVGSMITLGGQITGSADLSFLVGSNGGSGTIILTNPNNNWTGATNILVASAGIVRMGVNNALPQTTNLSFGTASISVGAFDMDGFNQTVASLSGTASAVGVVNTSSTLSTLTINGSAVATYTSPIAPTTGSTANIALNLASTNTGTLTLSSGTSQYSGGTTINGGTLLAANASGSATGTGPVTVGASGKLGSGTAGTISGHVDNSGTLLPGGTGAVGTLALSGGLTAEAGSGMNFDWGMSGANVAIDKIALGGATDPTILSTPGGAGSVNINLFDPNSEIRNQTYTLITYPSTTTLSGLNTSVFNVVAPTQGIAEGANFSITNNTTSHEIDLTVTNIANFITWSGDANGNGAWDVATTPNFNISGTPSTFHTFDNVTFDDTANAGGGNTPIAVTVDAGGVTPSAVTFNNSNRNYTISGGAIGGTGSLTKNGSGIADLTSANTYTGGTVVNLGTLGIGGDSSLGMAPATPTINLTLNKTSVSVATTLRFDADTTLQSTRNILITQSAGGGGPTFDTDGHNVTIAGQIFAGTGGANILKQGTGTLTLTGDNSTGTSGGYVGAVFVYAGAVNASQDVNLGKAGGGITLNGGGLQLGASFNPTGRPVTITGSGTIDTNSFNSTIDGVLSGTGALTKTGAGTLVLTNVANTFSGSTTITGGTLSIASAFTATSGITVNTGGTLQIAAGAGGSVINSSTLSLSGGSLDITNNTITFDTTVTGHDAATLEGDLSSAYDKGNWDLPGITSSSAAASHGRTTLGWNTSGNTFKIMYTLPGDANLDGKVDNTDLSLISSIGTTWATGDFNYDGVVNADDYALFMLGAAYGNIFAAPAPEPTGAALAIISAGMLSQRRRRFA